MYYDALHISEDWNVTWKLTTVTISGVGHQIWREDFFPVVAKILFLQFVKLADSQVYESFDNKCPDERKNANECTTDPTREEHFAGMQPLSQAPLTPLTVSQAPLTPFSRCRSQHVSVESSSLLHHNIYLWFICFTWWSIDELENLHADRTTVCFEPW